MRYMADKAKRMGRRINYPMIRLQCASATRRNDEGKRLDAVSPSLVKASGGDFDERELGRMEGLLSAGAVLIYLGIFFLVTLASHAYGPAGHALFFAAGLTTVLSAYGVRSSVTVEPED